eukprot:TRINITY_DN1437_c0_g1_i4.p1 TRINITY_DN1437_c0_g1~~TRINITY_DN1437_c0_g1_i4.p1  ORF type:complete len:327 (+),score=39.20 TRINITY_DN1437_c0_g1_i4:18-998(+)
MGSVQYSITAAAGLAVFYFFFRKYRAGGSFEDKVDLNGKNFLITGGTAGIGLQTAKELSKLGANVTITGRTVERCTKAVEEIKKETGLGSDKKVDHILLDLASLKNIREVATSLVQDKEKIIHCLINNAGAIYDQRTLTKDGFEATFAVNHLGTFLLTNLLLPKIRETKGRIVVLSSVGHYRVTSFHVDEHEMFSEENYNSWAAYAKSKLANVIFVKGLQKRLQGSGVDVFAVHPGLIQTEILNTTDYGLIKRIVMNLIFAIFAKTSLQGCQTTLYAACSPSLTGKGGEYLSDCAPLKPNSLALNEDLADKLWEFSEIHTAYGRTE